MIIQMIGHSPKGFVNKIFMEDHQREWWVKLTNRRLEEDTERDVPDWHEKK